MTKLNAIAYAAIGDYAEAARHIEAGLLVARASQDAEREGRLYLELARINAARGDHAAADQQLNTALTLLRNAPEVYRSYARELLDKLHRGEINKYEFVAYSI